MINKKQPQRKCMGCGESKDKKQLIRIVRLPEDENGQHEIIIDRTGKKSGRGAYICENSECLKKAKKTKRIDRVLSCEISVEIYGKLETDINRQQ